MNINQKQRIFVSTCKDSEFSSLRGLFLIAAKIMTTWCNLISIINQQAKGCCRSAGSSPAHTPFAGLFLFKIRKFFKIFIFHRFFLTFFLCCKGLLMPLYKFSFSHLSSKDLSSLVHLVYISLYLHVLKSCNDGSQKLIKCHNACSSQPMMCGIFIQEQHKL